MARRKNAAPIVGLAAISSAIKKLDGVLGNAVDRVQEIAVAIVEHGAGKGNGDMSKALDLVKVARKHRMNTAFIIGWFRYFGNCNVSLSANDGAGKVSLRSKDSKGYRGFDVEGARANNWFEAANDAGVRAKWYEGPTPEAYEPDTIGDVADQFTRFVDRMNKRLEDTKTVGGKEVPLVNLSPEDKERVHEGLSFISRIAATLSRHEDVQVLAAELARKREEAGQDEEVLAVLQPKKAANAG